MSHTSIITKPINALYFMCPAFSVYSKGLKAYKIDHFLFLHDFW